MLSGSGAGGLVNVHYLYDEFTRLAETRLAQFTLNYLNIA